MEAQKTIIDQEKFVFNNTAYIARTYHPSGRSCIYGEIVYADSGERPYRKMRAIAREYLRPYGIIIPTKASSNVTHAAVRKLIETIKEHKK